MHCTKTLALIICLLCALITGAQEISLAGQWQFATDKEDIGVSEKWFTRKLADVVSLPGSMTENNKGDDVTLYTKWTGTIYDSSFFFRPSLAKYRQPGNVKIPFWLTPIKYYVGVAWYQKRITIPKGWETKNIQLFLERSHIQTRVWIDDVEIGKNNSLVAPHAFAVKAGLKPGEHTITIRVDNRISDINVGPDSHSITDHTQGNWNGIVGKIILMARPPLFIHHVQVFPDIQMRSAKVLVKVVNTDNVERRGKLFLYTASNN
ncbi:MAG TPA: beta galactosidase jelly roll domain-containing protein, partial [Chitinophagaceae bacterium]